MGKRRTKNRTIKRLRLIPLILGGYGAFLGLGLVAIGLAEIKEGIGIVRLLIGLGMAGFGLLGIWDGVRDFIRPEKKAETPSVSQFILTDTSGKRSSLVTPEVLREQMDILAESEEPKRFDIRILPPLSAGEHGLLKQILCIYHGTIILVAFFDMTNDGYRICQKSMEPDMAVEWLKQLLAGNPDFSDWARIEPDAPQDEETVGQEEADALHDDATMGQEEAVASQDDGTVGREKADTLQDDETMGWEEANTMHDDVMSGQEEAIASQDDEGMQREDTDAHSGMSNAMPDKTGRQWDETDNEAENIDAFWRQLQTNQLGQMAYWHQLLVIFGESWHDEHKFFSARDVELAIEGIHEGKYQKAVLEWGTRAFNLFPGVQNDLLVIWCTNNTGKGDTKFLAREGTVTQVKFWLANYMNRGFFEELSGWADITAQIENEKRKGGKKHGKVF